MSQPGRDSDGGAISLLAGIGVGLLLGGIAALLLAPQSGEATRSQLKESADDALQKLRQSMEELRARVEEVAHTAREALPASGGTPAAREENPGPSAEGAPPA